MQENKKNPTADASWSSPWWSFRISTHAARKIRLANSQFKKLGGAPGTVSKHIRDGSLYGRLYRHLECDNYDPRVDVNSDSSPAN